MIHQMNHQKIHSLCSMGHNHTVLVKCLSSLRNSSMTELLLWIILKWQALVSIGLCILQISVHAHFSCGATWKTIVYSKIPQMLKQFEKFICEAYTAGLVETLQHVLHPSDRPYSCKKWSYYNCCNVIWPPSCKFYFNKICIRCYSVVAAPSNA